MIRTMLLILAVTATSVASAQESAPQPPMKANPPIRWISPEQQAIIDAEEARLAAERKAQAEHDRQLELLHGRLKSDECCTRPGARIHQTTEDKEAACTAEARKRAAGLMLVKIIAVSGDASRGRQFVRLSWDPRDAIGVSQAAFECFFENDRLATAGFAAILIADPPVSQIEIEKEKELRAKAAFDDEQRRLRDHIQSYVPRGHPHNFPDRRIHATDDEKKAACIARAREQATALPTPDKLTVAFRDRDERRVWTRLSWDARDAPDVKATSFECVFWDNELTSARFETAEATR